MALTAAGLLEPARAAFDWCRRMQRADGSWPIQIRARRHRRCQQRQQLLRLYRHRRVAPRAGHRRRVVRRTTCGRRCAKAIDFVIDLQVGYGEICWARSESGPLPEALLTGCASIFHSIRCALALADPVGDPQPEWELALGRLGHAIVAHPEAFTEKDRYSMDWYYPILGGALRGPAAAARIAAALGRFRGGRSGHPLRRRPALGDRCRNMRTGHGPGCDRAPVGRAPAIRARCSTCAKSDGSYWTGLVFADGKRWPEERTTWTGAAMILAADALSGTTAGQRDLPRADAAAGPADRLRLRMRYGRAWPVS